MKIDRLETEAVKDCLAAFTEAYGKNYVYYDRKPYRSEDFCCTKHRISARITGLRVQFCFMLNPALIDGAARQLRTESRIEGWSVRSNSPIWSRPPDLLLAAEDNDHIGNMFPQIWKEPMQFLLDTLNIVRKLYPDDIPEDLENDIRVGAQRIPSLADWSVYEQRALHPELSPKFQTKVAQCRRVLTQHTSPRGGKTYFEHTQI
jgi:hypothetical protein